MRIAIVSDIHGNLAALEAVFADIRRRGVDQVVNLGDSLSGPLLPRETAQFLVAEGWLSLAGNHERQLLACASARGGPSDEYAYSQLAARDLDWVRDLPGTAELDGGGVLLCHGTPSSDLQYLLETVVESGIRAANSEEVEARLGGVRASVVACGHSHVPRGVRARGGQVVVNPGSVGLQAYDDEHPHPHVVATGSPDARYAILERHGGRWLVSLLSVPYDHESMALLAQARGRPEWAHALRTGYMPIISLPTGSSRPARSRS